MNQIDIDKRVRATVILAGIVCLLSILLAVLGMYEMIGEAVISGVCGYFIWKKYSRAASTILFVEHALGTVLVIAAGTFGATVFVIKAVILFVVWRGMMATYEYHKPIEVMELTEES